MNPKKIPDTFAHLQVKAKSIPLGLRNFFVILFILLLSANSSAEEDQQGLVKKVTLPGGQVAIITEGPGEPRSIGSYSVRLYSGKNSRFPLDDFLDGTVRPRDGSVEKLVLDDLDKNGKPELVVIIRSAGSGSYLSADSFALSGGTVSYLGSVSGLSGKTDPVVTLKNKIEASTELAGKNKASTCGSISITDEKELPAQDSIVSINQIKEICTDYNQKDLWAKIEKDPPPNSFISDGCSLWFGTWKGISLYPACFLHDLKYWAGYPDEEVARLVADAELMIDIACLLGSTTMAETMFQGTRRGGHEMYKQSFSWGFGRVP